jgi:hypothetical protein
MKKLFYIPFLFLMVLQACSDLEGINDNPAGFNDLDPGFQLTKIQVDLAGHRDEVWSYDLGICSPLVQHLGGSWWTQHGGQYRVVEKGHWYTFWESTYPRELKNIQDVVDRTAGDPEMVNMNAAARIMRVYIYSRLTDLYGDIPYSEAIKGYTEQKFLPKYDEQQLIYASFFTELEQAIDAFDESKPTVSGDLFYDGNVAQWKKFGNSLRMRLGFRITKVAPDEAKKQVEAAIASGVMESNADICKVQYMDVSFTDGENRGNGRSQVFHATPNSEGFRLTNTLVDFMKGTSDPRLTIYGGTYLEDGTDITSYMQEGVTFGAMWWNEWGDATYTDGDGNSQPLPHTFKHMQPSKYIAALNAPFFHLTYAEVELLLAEAAARGWSGVTDAEDHFLKGIQASCEMMALYPGAPALEQDAIDDLKASYADFATEDFEGKMNAIHEQLWVNFFMNGLEAYADYRRSGYPELVPFTSVEWYTSGTDGVMPRRFYYPESEAIQNTTNWNDAVSRLGGTNDWLKRVWWDKE